MTKRYPFFREEDEETLAVIGEEAVASDLEGTYQKPYAVLTQKRLYCKNEAGNFITEAGALKSAKKGLLPGQNWFLLAAVLCLAAVVVLFFLLCNPWSRYMNNKREEAQVTIAHYMELKEEAEQCKKDVKEAEESYNALVKQLEDKRAAWNNAGYDDLEAQVDEIEARLESIRQLGDVSENRQHIQALKEAVDMLFTTAFYEPEPSLASQFGSYTEEELESLRQSRAEHFGIDISSIPTWQFTLSTGEMDAFLHSYEQIFGHFGFDTDFIFNYGLYNTLSEITRIWSEGAGYYRDDGWHDLPFRTYMISLQQRLASSADAFIVFSLLSRSCESYLNSTQDLPEDEASLQTMLDDCTLRLEESAGLRDEISELESQISGGTEAILGPLESRLAELERDIERAEEDYTWAGTLTNAIDRVKPLLIVLMVGLVLTAVLTVLKRVKLATVMAWITVAAGLLTNSSLHTIQRWYEDWPFTLAAGVLLVALALSVAALAYNRFRTMYQITHTTGIFNFTPSQYPASEFKNFTAQVESLKAGETAHG